MKYPFEYHSHNCLWASAAIGILGGEAEGRARLRGVVPVDPWNHPYQYSNPGKHNSDGYDVWSNGSGDGDEISPQNSFCLQCEWASGAWDATHVVNGNAVYELPFGVGKTNAQRVTVQLTAR